MPLIGLCLVLTQACATTKPTAVSSPLLSISAIGVATDIRDVSLARDVAQSRARKGLAKMVKPDAVSFVFHEAGDDSQLTLKILNAQLPPSTTQLDKLKAGWIAKATTNRSKIAIAAMEQMKTVNAEAEIKHQNPKISLMLAESRLVRDALRKTLGQATGPRWVKGSLTFVTHDEQVSDAGTKVTAKIHVKIEDQGPVSKNRLPEIHLSSSREHSSIGNWTKAIASLDRALSMEEKTEEWLLELADLHLKAKTPAKAALAFARAFELAPSKTEYLEKQIAAVKQIPDEIQAKKLQTKLDRLTKKTKKNK